MAAGSTALQVGVATVDITPPVGIELSGYGSRKGKPSTSIAHPLRAEAMVVKGQEGGAWALVTSDIIGYSADLVARVRERAAAQTGLAPEAILISATHTHSGPSVRKEYGNELDDYKDELESCLVDAIVEANANLAPGAFEAAWTEAPDLAHNRRVVQEDGTVQNVWLDEEGSHTGYFDPTVLLVALRRPDGAIEALIVNYGCHPVTLGPSSMAISADYVGYLKDALEAAGLAQTVMFALAGAGNINPRVCIQVGAEYPKAMGEKLADIVKGAVSELKAVAAGPVASSRQPLSFVSQRKWSEQSGREQGEPLETEVMALRAGDLGAVSVPGELFSEYARIFRDASAMPYTLVVSLANDGTGYLPVDEAMPQGGHEVNHRAAAEGVQDPLTGAAKAALAAVTS